MAHDDIDKVLRATLDATIRQTAIMANRPAWHDDAKAVLAAVVTLGLLAVLSA
ncbi:MAG: hypothetical protein AAF667_10215 [Pseudomonadota bacterium]